MKTESTRSASRSVSRASQAQRSANISQDNQPKTKSGSTKAQDIQKDVKSTFNTKAQDTVAQNFIDKTQEAAPKSKIERSVPTGQVGLASEVPVPQASPRSVPRAVPDLSVPRGPQEDFDKLISNNPNIRTNQDLINHLYQEGGGSWGGASQAAERYNQDLNALTRNRDGVIDRSSATPTNPAAPAAPTAPTGPAAPTPPTRPDTTTPSTNPVGNVSATADTSRMSEAERYDHYSSLIQQNGGQLKTGPNERNIISLRRETDADVRGGRGSYDDRTAMLWTDSQGRKRVTEYQSNTEPSARYRGRIGVDANGDGRLDQGRLPAGYYEYRTGSSNSLGRVLRPTQSTMAERDINQDGLFNAADRGAMGSAGRSMLFHAGGNTLTGSAGCQTMAPGEYNRFWSDLNSSGNPGNIGYTLINL